MAVHVLYHAHSLLVLQDLYAFIFFVFFEFFAYNGFLNNLYLQKKNKIKYLNRLKSQVSTVVICVILKKGFYF